MLDEERLQYVGAMVLGLNDALVELTDHCRTFICSYEYQNCCSSGIITGISATLSMYQTIFIAERAENNPKCNEIKCLYRSNILSLLLFLFFHILYFQKICDIALITMLATVIFIILFFNYYISVAKDLPFMKRFLEMAGISLFCKCYIFCNRYISKNS